MTTTPINDTSIASGFNVDELTEGSLTGKGVLDVLLQTLRLHLDREFTSGRITGTAYATVYAQAITAFLAQAAQYAISKAKLPLELQLLQEQIVLSQKQQAKLNYEIEEIIQRIEVVVPNQIAQITSERLRIDQIRANLVLESTNISKQGSLIDSQKESTDAQIAQVTYTTSNVLPAQVALTNAQKDSADAQTALYAQKVVTEQAQATNAPAATSVMGVQNALMEQQKNQIIRDAEQKTAKIMLDSWQTIFTTDQALPPTGDIALLLTHTNAAKLKMLQGVGAV